MKEFTLPRDPTCVSFVRRVLLKEATLLIMKDCTLARVTTCPVSVQRALLEVIAWLFTKDCTLATSPNVCSMAEELSSQRVPDSSWVVELQGNIWLQHCQKKLCCEKWRLRVNNSTLCKSAMSAMSIEKVYFEDNTCLSQDCTLLKSCVSCSFEKI